MTKQLADLFKTFDSMTTEEQFEKIREVRNTRSIERPAVAKRRHKKEVKKQEKAKDKARKLIAALSDEDKEALIKRLTGGIMVTDLKRYGLVHTEDLSNDKEKLQRLSHIEGRYYSWIRLSEQQEEDIAWLIRTLKRKLQHT